MCKNNNKKTSKHQTIKEYIIVVVLGISLNLLFNCFFGISKINGLSMYPTLNDKEYIFYQKFNKDYDYNDIVIFKSNLNKNNKKMLLIKRIIAKTGDKITIKDGEVFVNDIKLDEPYLSDDVETYGQLEYIVPKDSYFVLGDNRSDSVDSRDPIIGCVLAKNIEGKLNLKNK